MSGLSSSITAGAAHPPAKHVIQLNKSIRDTPGTPLKPHIN
ncbi:hypothetical protein C1O63_1537 [Dehalococcoides mccartyi]|nr:hypothetical protein C1O63_1537 [Dehalococcoides mccartyi]